MAKGERLELRLDTELRAKLDELAKLRDVAASVVVRRAILDAHRLAFPDALPKQPLQAAIAEVSTALPDSLADFHGRLWDRPPSSVQASLYHVHGRGYVGGATSELVDAVLTTALYIAPLRPDDSVVILAPPEASALALERVTAALAASKGKQLAGAVAGTIHRMKMGLPNPWPAGEPRVWVAVGVVPDAAPRWLRRRLVEIMP